MTKKSLSNIVDLNYESSIEEFKKVITGFNSDKDRLLTQNKGAASLSVGSAENLKFLDSISNDDAKVLNRLIGTISGGYYIRDMITGKAFGNLNLKDLFTFNKVEASVTGANVLKRQNFYFYHGSAQRSIGKRTNDNIKKVLKKSILGFNYLFQDNSEKSDTDPDSTHNLSIGAVEFTRHTLSLGKRYGDALSVFYNAIPSIDMSLCTPYLNVKILVPQNSLGVKSMGHEVQFRFQRHGKDKGLISKAINVIESFKDQSVKYDEFGMETFLSPQTLTNSDIRSIDKNILEPNSTLMTLKSCSIAIAGMGVGLFCSKNARLQFVLHDRSRLRDIEPLVSPKQFAKSRVIIEYGWSHPQGGTTSNNVIGKFLNSMRDKGVFVVKGSSFNFTNGGHVSVSVDLAMMGTKIPKNASVAAGDYVQASVFKNEMQEVAELIKKSKSDNENTSQVEVRKKALVSIKNAKSINSLMERKTFMEIKKLISEGNKTAYIDALKRYLAVTDMSGNEFKNKMAASANTAIEKKIKRLPVSTSIEFDAQHPEDFFLREFMVSVLQQSQIDENEPEGFTSLGNVIMLFVAYPLMATCQFDEVQVFFYPFNQHSAGAYFHTTASFPISIKSLRGLFRSADDEVKEHQNMSVSTFMNRLDSKIIRNPVYEHYGLSAENAQLKFFKNITEEEFVAALNDGLTPEVSSAIDTSLIKEADIAKIKEEALAKARIESSESTDAEKNEALKGLVGFNQVKKDIIDRLKAQQKDALKDLYEHNRPPDVAENSSEFSSEVKFVQPNLSYYLETVTPYEVLGGNDTSVFKSIANQFKEANKASQENKTILRIHVYDEEAIADKSQELLLTLMRSGEVLRAKDMGRLQFLKQRSKSKKKRGKEIKRQGKSPINNLSYNDIKDIIKQSMPSITIGASNSNVTSFSANSTTSNEIANVIFITEQKATQDLGRTQGVAALSNLNDMTVIPAVGSLDGLGMPLLQRGQQFFIDAGTGTTIDSIYTVQSVNHDIGESGFKTTAKVIYTGQSSVDTLRAKLEDLTDEEINLTDKQKEKAQERFKKRQQRKRR